MTHGIPSICLLQASSLHCNLGVLWHYLASLLETTSQNPTLAQYEFLKWVEYSTFVKTKWTMDNGHELILVN